jgi:hypothetical protein
MKPILVAWTAATEAKQLYWVHNQHQIHDEHLHLANLAVELLPHLVGQDHLDHLDNWALAHLLFKMRHHQVCPPAAQVDLYPMYQLGYLRVHQSCPRQPPIKTVIEYSNKLLEHVNDELQHQARLKAAVYLQNKRLPETFKEYQ